MALAPGYAQTLRGFGDQRDPGHGAISIAPGECLDDTGTQLITVPTTTVVEVDTSGINGLDRGVPEVDRLYCLWMVQGPRGAGGLISRSFTKPVLPVGFDAAKRRVGSSRLRQAGIHIWWHASRSVGQTTDRWRYYTSSWPWRALADSGGDADMVADVATEVSLLDWVPAARFSEAVELFFDNRGTSAVRITETEGSPQWVFELPPGFAGALRMRPLQQRFFYVHVGDLARPSLKVHVLAYHENLALAAL